MAIKPHLKPRIKGEKESYLPLNSSEEAMICLECPLPAESCDQVRCSRYKEERAKLLKRLKNGRKEID